MREFKYSLAAVGLAALVVSTTAAANWPHWRGPDFNGSSPETKLPDDFSPTNNVKWVAPMPGPSASTPVVWGDHVFVSSTDLRTKTVRAIALDRRSGKELWNHEAAQGIGYNDNSNFASPSPVTDGQRVYFLYGTGDLLAFDFEGNKVWSRNLQKDYGQFAYQWTYGASPTLFDGRLYIQVLQRDEPVHGRGCKDGPCESFLLALDPKTGKEFWRHVRPSDAPMETKEAYSTPIPFEHKGRVEILITGGDCISGHDPKTGKEFWRWGTWNPGRISHWRLVPTPVASEHGALVCAPKGSPVFSVKHGGKGTLDDSWVGWKSEQRDISTDVSTPLFYRGRYYVLNSDKKILSRVDPATGEADWIGELGTRAKIEGSPTGADGKVYFMDFRGTIFIIPAEKEFKILRAIPMGDDGEDRMRSTVIVSQGNLYIRTNGKLYCVGG